MVAPGPGNHRGQIAESVWSNHIACETSAGAIKIDIDDSPMSVSNLAVIVAVATYMPLPMAFLWPCAMAVAALHNTRMLARWAFLPETEVEHWILLMWSFSDAL